MHTVRSHEAPGYDAPGHSGMAMRRLQGREAGPSDGTWIGLSVIAPGGGTTLAASPVEKFYVVLSGRLQVQARMGDDETQVVLDAQDSCRIAPNEARRLHNAEATPCTVLLVMGGS
ncbi:cupin domain-containing protein [Pseudorhodoferax sp.]|uniref:cupin domain-containing protein n=1 Tax=Pseudorhodoferax sp. TaxID=1993553 RepID=UPI002DD66553|nr:cupin domain-containing protein [Pseudorhodoferax sp.]